jgi:hypothetical protein
MIAHACRLGRDGFGLLDDLFRGGIGRRLSAAPWGGRGQESEGDGRAGRGVLANVGEYTN